jgi:hypothetical protein
MKMLVGGIPRDLQISTVCGSGTPCSCVGSPTWIYINSSCGVTDKNSITLFRWDLCCHKDVIELLYDYQWSQRGPIDDPEEG